MLMDAAVELCDRQGFERTTVDQIAAIADVSPRTFSRYFATKDAIALALIDEAIDKTAVELSRLPVGLPHLEALRLSFRAMYTATKSAPPGDLTADRLLSMVRIIVTSPTLRQASAEYRPHAVNVELAKRMGVDISDRGLKLISAVWSSILVTALADLADDDSDWEHVGIDDILARLDSTFSEFTGLTATIRQAV